LNQEIKTVDAILKRSGELKQAFVDFVLEAEGELAESLEAYTAEHASRERFDITQRDLLIDTFLIEGQVGDKKPLDLFLDQPELSESDRNLVECWRRSFIGLFKVIQVLPDGLALMNWLTAKHYTVKLTHIASEDRNRFKPGEILLTRIAPVSDSAWMFSGPCTVMGNLGKPKLAVAIGNFKRDHKDSLYADAPELLEEAWQSVERYHQEFLEFFGNDKVTLPGYQLSKKIAELQETLIQRRLAAAGIDSSKSLAEIAAAAGVESPDIEAAAADAGVDAKVVSQVLGNKGAAKMVMPKVELPAELKKAEQVTVLAHPRWGQMKLPTYSQFQAVLEAEDWQTVPGAAKLVRRYLEDPAINAFIWHQLAQQHPTQLEKLLQAVLERPNFRLEPDLDSLLQEFNKPLSPELPDIASVPLHLHNLFQEALAEVSKLKSKGKGKKKATGFQQP